jgi:hypothetical protein
MEASANEMIAIARALDGRPLLRYAINMSGNSLQQRGRYDEARKRFAEGLERALTGRLGAAHRAVHRQHRQLRCLSRSLRGVARRSRARAGALNREQVNDYTAAIELISIGGLLRVLGRPAQAIERAERGARGVPAARFPFDPVHRVARPRPRLRRARRRRDEREVARRGAARVAPARRAAGRDPGAARVDPARLRCRDTAAARTRVWEALKQADRARSAALQAQCAAPSARS